MAVDLLILSEAVYEGAKKLKVRGPKGIVFELAADCSTEKALEQVDSIVAQLTDWTPPRARYKFKFDIWADSKADKLKPEQQHFYGFGII